MKRKRVFNTRGKLFFYRFQRKRHREQTNKHTKKMKKMKTIWRRAQLWSFSSICLAFFKYGPFLHIQTVGGCCCWCCLAWHWDKKLVLFDEIFQISGFPFVFHKQLGQPPALDWIVLNISFRFRTIARCRKTEFWIAHSPNRKNQQIVHKFTPFWKVLFVYVEIINTKDYDTHFFLPFDEAQQYSEKWNMVNLRMS